MQSLSMYRTMKHEKFVSEPMASKSVMDVPGIGDARGGRLMSAGITTANQLASLYDRMGRSEFESFLNSTCGQNSRWTGMTIDALDEYNKSQFAVKIVTSSNLPQMSIKSESIEDHLLPELSAEVASLRLNVQKLEDSIKELSSGDITKFDELIKLHGTVGLLRLRITDCAKTNRALDDKITSNQCKTVELCADIHALGGELKDLSGKIAAIQLDFQQAKDNGILNKQSTLREHEHFTKLYETLKCLQLLYAADADAIKELNGKTESIEDQLRNQNAGLRQIIVSKNKEMERVYKKMDEFEFQIKKIEETNCKLNKKLFAMFCLNSVVAFICLCFGLS